MAFEKKQSGPRAPVTAALRRLPGQSVREERDRILNDKVLEYFTMAAGWCFLAAWEWLRRWVRFDYAAEVFTAMAVLMALYCGYRMIRLRRDIRNLNQAEKGERHVSNLLMQLRRFRYVSFDDIVSDRCNIDHVLVGPGGVYAIETKAYSVFGNGQAGIGKDGVLRLGGSPALKNPLGQAKSAAVLVAQELKRCLRRDIWVHPVIVLPGWSVQMPGQDVGVTILGEGAISEFFQSRAASLTDRDITEIASHLDQIARV